MDQIVALLESLHVDPLALLATVGLIIAAAIVVALVNRFLTRLLTPAVARVGLRTVGIASLARAVTITLWTLAVLLLLDLWGVSVGGLWTVMVSVATIIGVGFLATWAMVSNITASVFLAIWHPFHIGDTVELLPENLKGRAVERNLMFTVLREDSGSVLQIPNNLFFQKMFRVTGG